MKQTVFFHNPESEETSRGKNLSYRFSFYSSSVQSLCTLLHIRDFTHPLSYAFIAHFPLTAAPLPNVTAVGPTFKIKKFTQGEFIAKGNNTYQYYKWN